MRLGKNKTQETPGFKRVSIEVIIAIGKRQFFLTHAVYGFLEVDSTKYCPAQTHMLPGGEGDGCTFFGMPRLFYPGMPKVAYGQRGIAPR